jgi:hypothetical protein
MQRLYRVIFNRALRGHAPQLCLYGGVEIWRKGAGASFRVVVSIPLEKER